MSSTAGDASARSGAVRAAVAVAEAHGLAVDEPVVLRDLSNVLVHLAPHDVVARVATTTGTVRSGLDWLRREVEITSFLAAAGAPAVAPAVALPPGPFAQDGLAISFWPLLRLAPDPVDPLAAGRALHACHDALADYRGELPRMAAPLEGLRLAATLVADGSVTGEQAAVLERASAHVRDRLDLPARPVHGDAHLNNALHLRDGRVLWGDWEDTFAGPVEWDIACLVTAPLVTGVGRERAAAARRALDTPADPAVLDACVTARALQIAVWTVVIARAHPERGARAEAWFAWLAGALGQPPT